MKILTADSEFSLEDLPYDLTLIYTRAGGWELWRSVPRLLDPSEVEMQQIAGTNHTNWIIVEEHE